MISALLLALSLPANTLSVTASSEQIAILHCGDDELRMASQVLTGKTAPLSPVSQTLTLRVGAQRVQVVLEVSNQIEVSGQLVQDRYVASWACLTDSRKDHYVLVSYACAIDTGNAGDCEGRKEWFRLLDRRGRFADARVHNDAARERVYQRLGIANAMAKGVAMTSVLN